MSFMKKFPQQVTIQLYVKTIFCIVNSDCIEKVAFIQVFFCHFLSLRQHFNCVPLDLLKTGLDYLIYQMEIPFNLKLSQIVHI